MENENNNVQTEQTVAPNIQTETPVTPEVQASEEAPEFKVAELSTSPTGERYQGEIIVKGVNIMQYSASDIPEELVDEMTEEQANLFLQGLSEKDTKTFNVKFGYVESVPMSPEELEKRKVAREKMAQSLSVAQASASPKQSQAEQEPRLAAPVKTEQTGTVIFGKRD